MKSKEAVASGADITPSTSANHVAVRSTRASAPRAWWGLERTYQPPRRRLPVEEDMAVHPPIDLAKREFKHVKQWAEEFGINLNKPRREMTLTRLIFEFSGDERFVNSTGRCLLLAESGRADLYCDEAAMRAFVSVATTDERTCGQFLDYAADVQLAGPGISCAETESETLGRLKLTTKQEEYAQALYLQFVIEYVYVGIYNWECLYVADPALLEFCSEVAKVRFKQVAKKASKSKKRRSIH